MLKPPMILLYHGLARVSKHVDPRNLIVEPERFRRQVEVLKCRGYAFVTVSDFARSLAEGGPRSQLCALTFDDGTSDHAELLPGLLDALDVPATLYVCPGLLGRPNPFVRPESGLRLMDIDQLRRVGEHPRIEIGSHTRIHTILEHATEREAYDEMAASKAELEDLIGREVPTFAYPTCVYSVACPAAAAKAGYVAAVTCGLRGGWRPYELVRQSISARDGDLSFGLKARGFWDPIRRSWPGRAAPWASTLLKRRR